MLSKDTDQGTILFKMQRRRLETPDALLPVESTIYQGTGGYTPSTHI